MAGNIDDRSLSHADAVVHVAAECADIVRAFCVEASEMFGPNVRIRSGVVRPTLYTGGAMQQFAYENQVRQQSGNTMPHVFLVPMCKTSEWWAKDWMERHTYFLPRYNWRGAKLKDGHALAAAPGIPHLYRRTYKHQVMPAPQGEYDFLNYFECADSGVPIFHEVCAALRDQRRNPEWHFVREGPTWRGHRASTWAELFD
ncbi:hypothetical protein Acid345_1948 [Candidatus Koribacter versatilis Ellin345]|uniref:Uncharacterized protein n=2 Tax=Candidatus Korobacter versatilis TaxID=658062 RepID=Q1IQA1_KORVE|nr:hypothetical protein Acid345_1948 [Candidatus Koribacter versatilis Ellin345]